MTLRFPSLPGSLMQCLLYLKLVYQCGFSTTENNTALSYFYLFLCYFIHCLLLYVILSVLSDCPSILTVCPSALTLTSKQFIVQNNEITICECLPKNSEYLWTLILPIKGGHKKILNDSNVIMNIMSDQMIYFDLKQHPPFNTVSMNVRHQDYDGWSMSCLRPPRQVLRNFSYVYC